MDQFGIQSQEDKHVTSVHFKEGLLQEVFKLHLVDKKLKLNAEATLGLDELLRHFVTEAVWRTAKQCNREGGKEASVEHLEKVLPQLILDFS